MKCSGVGHGLGCVCLVERLLRHGVAKEVGYIRASKIPIVSRNEKVQDSLCIQTVLMHWLWRCFTHSIYKEALSCPWNVEGLQ